MYTIGMYLADRLAHIGLKHHFAVAGDYNLVLLDQLLTDQRTQQIYCCNELNCGFSAEGYARVHGAAAAIVTFSVGAISAMNAIGGAYAENLPLIVISGAPNTNDFGNGLVLHHTLGTTDYGYQLAMVRHITCAAERIMSVDEAPAKIDHVIRTALRDRKPAYLEIPSNLANAPCDRPGPIGGTHIRHGVDIISADAALLAAEAWLNARQNIVMLVGSKVRSADAEQLIVELADRIQCAVLIMAAAKGFFPEDHPGFRGVYWGEVSSPGAEALIEAADGIVCLAPLFSDGATVGWRAWPKGDRVMTLDIYRATFGGVTYSDVGLHHLLKSLVDRAPVRPASRQASTLPPPLVDPACVIRGKLTNHEMVRQIQALITSNTTLTVDSGDSWFNAVGMPLPAGARVELEMQWGHIGWSIPAAFGNATGSPERQHMVLVGDGAFQLTAQEVSQMIRYELPVIIFLVNNRGYVIEIAIHDGPYNYFKNWDYAGLVDAFNAESGHGLGLRATTSEALEQAIAKAVDNRRGPTLIECCIDTADCTEIMKIWGRRLAESGARLPRST